MTTYNLKPMRLPSLVVQEKKEQRRKVLASVRQRRREQYRNFLKKRKLQTSGELL